MQKSRNLWESFKYALEGITYTLKTQRNMRVHFSVALLLGVVGKHMGLRVYEILAVIFAIALVMITEMINTAVESVVDMFTERYHPLAKTAKNVAAGAVLIAAATAVVVGYIVFIESGRLGRLL